MKARMDRVKFDRMLAERGLSVNQFCRVFGVSSATVAKIRRDEAIDIKVIERIGQQSKLWAPKPEIREWLAAS